jgi:hypothetical protein
LFEKASRDPLKASDGINLNLPRSIGLDKKEFEKTRKVSYLNSYLNLFENKYRKFYINVQNSVLGSTDIKTNRDQS